MRRRDFVAGLGSAAAAPLAARAQQPAMPVIGILGSARAEGWAIRMAAFMQGLKRAETSPVPLTYPWTVIKSDCNCFMTFFPVPKCLATSLILTILPRHRLGAPP
jgi:hypothetical protein